jgi:hypothetical protein
VKEAGEHWVVQEKKRRKVFSRGLWVLGFSSLPAINLIQLRVTSEDDALAREICMSIPLEKSQCHVRIRVLECAVLAS